MTMPFFPRLATAAALALLMAACASDGGSRRDGNTTIGNLAKERRDETRQRLEAPREDERGIEADPRMALENYRRLLELPAGSDTRAEAQRRLADLQLELDDIDPGPESERRLREAVALYRRLLQERPRDPGNDRVLYQLARAQQGLGDVPAAIDTLARLGAEFPRSPYAADGRFRRAELLFGSGRFEEAVPEYEAVLALEGQTPFFEAAQYKYGWTLYKLARYEEAIETFFTILDRELPEGEPADPESTLAAVAPETRDLVADVLRVTSLSYTALGGGEAVSASFERRGTPRFYALVYNSLGAFLLDNERYTDAAEAFAAFVDRHPRHRLAPDFQESVIAAYVEGGFPELVIAEKQRYVDTYDPRSAYWSGEPASEAVLLALRGHLDDLSGHFHARAQESPRDVAWPSASEDFLTAAGWYQRILEVFPDAEDAPEVHFLFAETLYAGGQIGRAAEEYHRTAYDYPAHGRSAEAGYNAVLAYYEAAEQLPEETRPEALQRAVDEALQFAEHFVDHPQRLPVLTRAAEDLYSLEAFEEAIGVAARVLNAPEAPPELLRSALTVRADAEFTLERFAAAELSYLDLLPMQAGASEEAERVADQLALSIYRQGEAQRAAGNPGAAVAQFLRIGMVSPDADIRPSAEYEAAILLTESEDWAGAARVLEGFRARFPEHELLPDADKQLAFAYEQSNQPRMAAATYLRIASRSVEQAPVREEAAWNAARLFEQSQASAEAVDAYEGYLQQAGARPERRTEAYGRLVALTRGGDPERHRYWLQQAVAADRGEGDPASQLLAAESSLALGEMAASAAREVRLQQPLRDSLAARRAEVEAAAGHLRRAAGYGFDAVTPAATHTLATVYRDFAQAVLDSERPRGLSAAEQEEYNLLLEDQAFPLEEQAIALYEANLRRITEGLWDGSIRASWRALEAMVPGRYAREPILEPSYDTLR